MRQMSLLGKQQLLRLRMIRAIWIDDDARKIKIRLSDRTGKSSKTTYTLINLIAAMADEEDMISIRYGMSLQTSHNKYV